jgi:peroxiredoxin Q/BCP|tara:strand:+ start:10729 stop:10935 length:207 start_codon:yes stop_codon:yes gene_type:complete
MKISINLALLLLSSMIIINAQSKSDAIKVGQEAPDFSLISDSNKKISLKDFRGQRVVIYFFPKADTPG